ncbi:phosphoinositide phosphatase SAC4-like [Raphanus sativus]|uniref:Phosphoinositide phosphatase SAC4-like n=1 Tax=Raphanus sativus TaxID=3726 RepID=A0A9W3D8M6_RAPSA|nr:phosphoinositide phosphatase SAC4-like [Raphanus sativus]
MLHRVPAPSNYISIFILGYFDSFSATTLSEAGRNFKLTLIARRSRHNAGTRCLKRGINESGNVANDVETEQILSEDVPKDHPTQINSVVQNRGSIPLFWSQETSGYSVWVSILASVASACTLTYLNTKERRPRESILWAEFANATDFINKDLPEENRLRFLHWDLHKHFQSKTANVLTLLGKVAVCALMLTGFFYHQVTPAMMLEGCMSLSSSDAEMSPHNSSDDDCGEYDSVEKTFRPKNVASGDYDNKPRRLQRGVLRTNFIDCLDRTNVAQYAYGWAALGQQLHALGITDATTIELDDPCMKWLRGKEPMEAEPSGHTKICDDFTDSFKQWVAYGEALCH